MKVVKPIFVKSLSRTYFPLGGQVSLKLYQQFLWVDFQLDDENKHKLKHLYFIVNHISFLAHLS